MWVDGMAMCGDVVLKEEMGGVAEWVNRGLLLEKVGEEEWPSEEGGEEGGMARRATTPSLWPTSDTGGVGPSGGGWGKRKRRNRPEWLEGVD